MPFDLPEKKESAPAETKEEYLHKIERSISFIKEHDLPKLVIARKKHIQFSEINLRKSLSNLCMHYPSAFVYAFQKDDMVWIGAFSELLGKYSPSTGLFETMSLAGTLPVCEKWTEKEIEEQKPVTEYIKNSLESFSDHVHLSETYDHISGNIKHLRTDFKAQIQEADLPLVIEQLHPTPAVCGIPKEFCKNAIREIENFDRQMYAGYSQIEHKGSIYYFVNLRCGRFFKDSAEIYVGGGITALSDPEKEWKETELKAEAVLRNLVIS